MGAHIPMEFVIGIQTLFPMGLSGGTPIRIPLLFVGSKIEIRIGISKMNTTGVYIETHMGIHPRIPTRVNYPGP